METFNTYISMEVARCTELQWALVIASSPRDVAPNYVKQTYTDQTYNMEVLDTIIWYHLAIPSKVPPSLKEKVTTTKDLDTYYLWVKQSHTATAYQPKNNPTKPTQPSTTTPSDSSSSAGMWILLLLHLVAGMFLYSER